MELSILKVDLQNPLHCDQVVKLLNDYMNDPMGNNSQMPKGLAPKIISGLKAHVAYLGFFVLADDRFAGLANCNVNFSTFQAKPIMPHKTAIAVLTSKCVKITLPPNRSIKRWASPTVCPE